MVERGSLDQITGERRRPEILEAADEKLAEKVPAIPADLGNTEHGFGRLFLRLLVLEHARTVTWADQDVRSTQRWKMLAATFRFGPVERPALRLCAKGLKSVKFATIEKSFGPLRRERAL